MAGNIAWGVKFALALMLLAPSFGVPALAATHEKTELMPESSGEFSRKHVTDDYGREVELHIFLRNGESVVKTFHANGKLKEETQRLKSGAVKLNRQFARDGKTLTSGKEARLDGTTKWELSSEPDGSSKKTTYWYDGKRVFSVEISRKDGSVEQQFFRKDGSLWVKKSGPDAAKLQSEFFDKAGALLGKSQALPDGSTVYSPAVGNTQIRQYWKEERSYYYYGASVSWNLLRVEELDSQGVLVRTLVMRPGGYSVAEVHRGTADGGKVVRRLRWDNSVESEETFDKDGKSLGSRSSFAERLEEKIDRDMLRRAENSDPVQRWQQQEDSPYYRDQPE